MSIIIKNNYIYLNSLLLDFNLFINRTKLWEIKITFVISFFGLEIILHTYCYSTLCNVNFFLIFNF